MANIKNFGLVGVGSDVQFGKSGPRLINDAGTFKFRNAANAAGVDVQVKNLIADDLSAGAGKLITIGTDANAGKLVLGADISTLAAAADLTALTTRVTTAETDINNLEAADIAIDGRLDALESKASVDTAALQAEIDRVETAVGLNTDGTLTALVGNYLNVEGDAATTAATIAASILKLDAAIKARADAILAEKTRAEGQESAIRGEFAAADLVLKNYVDSAMTGLTWEAPVDDIGSALPVADALADGYRFANTADGKIYTVTVTEGVGAFDAGVALVDGAAFFDKSDETGYVFNGTQVVQFTGTGQTTAGLGLKKTGNRLDVEVSSTGGLTFTPNDTDETSVLSVKLDGTTLALGTDGLKIADATLSGIDTKIATAKTEAIAGAKTYTDARELILQAAIDAIETGAGLGTDGAYVADEDSNYLDAATSLMDADMKLDAQIKSVADSVAALGTGSITSLQNEVDAIETALGFEANGTKLDFASVNYVAAADTVKAAIEKLDAALKAADTAYKAADTALDGRLDTLEAKTLKLDDLTDVVITGNTEEVLTNLVAGQTLRYNGTEFVNAQLSTADVTEGANLYFTAARAQAAISVETVATPATDAKLTYANGVLGLANVASIKYVDDKIAQEVIDRDAAIAAAVQAGTSGGAKAHYAAFNFNAAGEMTIGAVKGFVHRVKVYVDTAATSDAALQIGVTGANGSVVSTADVDSSVTGVYVVEVANLFAETATLKIFGAEACVGKVIVEYYAN